MLIRCCPSCKSKNVARSMRRGALDFLVLPLFLLRPYRCLSCDNRYYGWFLSKRRVSRQLVRTWVRQAPVVSQFEE
jgi:hypothetical protein